MNILVMVNDMILPNKGGGAPRVDSIAKALVKEGHNVVVFAPFDCDLIEVEKQLGYKVVNMKFIPRRDPKKVMKTVFYTPSLIFRTLFLVKKHDIDLVFAHNIMSGFPAMVSAKVYGLPFAFDPTDFIAEYVPRRTLFGKLVYKFANYFENLTARKSDVLMTNTFALKNELERRHNRKVPVVYDSIDFNVFYPSSSKNKKFAYILQGGMDRQDCLEILVPAVNKLKDKVQNFEVLIIGDGNAIPLLKKEVKDKGLESHFFFSGWVSQEEVRDYMSSSHVGLVILPKDVSGRSRLTLRMLEYWACKLAVIVPRLEAVEEVVNESNGCFYEAEDSKDLSSAMLRLYEDEELREELSEAGFSAVQDFRSEFQGKRVVSILKEKSLL